MRGVPQHHVARRLRRKSGRRVLCGGRIGRFDGSMGPITLKSARSFSEIRLDGRERDAQCELLVEREKSVSDADPPAGLGL
jgi:hypothetical protein